MKVLLVVSVFVVLAAAAPSGEIELLDAIDFDAVEANDAEREKMVGCLLGKIPCGDLQALKDAVIKVVKDQCTGCNESQKAKYDRVTKKFQERHADSYNDFMKLLATA